MTWRLDWEAECRAMLEQNRCLTKILSDYTIQLQDCHAHVHTLEHELTRANEELGGVRCELQSQINRCERYWRDCQSLSLQVREYQEQVKMLEGKLYDFVVTETEDEETETE